MNLLKIAWRNLWRNRKRTAITTASILFAVLFAVLMRSFQLGFYDHMIKNAIESYSGFIQIQHIDYQDNPSLDNSFSMENVMLENLKEMDEIKSVIPRVQGFTLASTGEKSKPVVYMGIDPIKEKELSNPENMLVRYRITSESLSVLNKDNGLSEEIKERVKEIVNKSYSNTGTIAMDLLLDEQYDKDVIEKIANSSKFNGEILIPGDKGALVSDRLAKYLNISVGDTLILSGVGYHGATAADLFAVRGIIKIANPELDNKVVYIDINHAQDMAGMENQISYLSVNLKDNSEENMYFMQQKISDLLNGENLLVRNWHEFNEVLYQQIQSDNQSGKVFLALLYFVIFFGIFGTVLMMIHERYREFGVLVSIGMQKTKLAIIMVYEMILIGLLGVISGTTISLPFIYYFNIYPIRLAGDLEQVMEDMGFEPVMPLSIPDIYMVWQGLIVALMVVLACIYPLRKVFSLKESEALRA